MEVPIEKQIKYRGYRPCRYAHNHPRAFREFVYEHILIAEAVLGRYLPHGAVVHHVNEDKHDNNHANLVICENDNYHKLLHVRSRALHATVDANKLWCSYCKKYHDADSHYGYSKITGKLYNSCKECGCIKSKAYRHEKQELVKARRMSYRRSHKDQIRIANQRNYAIRSGKASRWSGPIDQLLGSGNADGLQQDKGD